MNRTYQDCPDCGQTVSSSNITKHQGSQSCLDNQATPEDKGYKKVKGGKARCLQCGKTYSIKGIGTHIWRAHGSGESHDPNRGYKEDRDAWNKDLCKETDDRVAQMSETIREGYASGRLTPTFEGRRHTKEARRKQSLAKKQHNPGGWCNYYDYEKEDGSVVKLQGTWEVRFADALANSGLRWKRPSAANNLLLDWQDTDGSIHTYFPDFYVPYLSTYYEVKGHWWGDDKEKMSRVKSQNPQASIVIVREKDLEYYEEHGVRPSPL